MFNKYIVVAITALVTFVFGTIYYRLSKFKDKLSSFVYYKGGGEEGGHQTISLRAMDDKTALLTFAVSKGGGEELESTEQTVSIESLREIEKIFYKYYMRIWAKFKRSQMTVLDADTCSFDFSFGPQIVSYSDNQKLPPSYLKAVAEMLVVISKYRDEAKDQ